MSHELKFFSEAANACGACRTSDDRQFDLTMAFQPIVNVATRTVVAYEALVRGRDGAGAGQVMSRVNDSNRYAFDQQCRVKAIELAARLGIAARGARLSVNFMPGAVYSPAACIQKTLQAAREFNFPLDAIVFEITEGEQVRDTAHITSIAKEYAKHGFTLALDDFGAGYSGLNLFASLNTIGILKLDGSLVRNIDTDPRAERIVATIAELCRGLGTIVLAECIETVAEYEVLRRCGIEWMQGYLFAKPGFECLPEVSWPATEEFAEDDTVARQPARFPAAATVFPVPAVA